MSVETDEVAAVAAFYRKTATVLAVAAGDLDDHRFGTWADAEDDHGDLSRRFVAIGRALAQGLRAQADSAAALSEALTRGLDQIRAADDESARTVRLAGGDDGAVRA
ncbi:hypothetical protein ACLQ3C_10945 [Gordonia sp. DT30]|uniref:hypothetical protein n=1 Tax=unclassified Gordonia (in: high G+C Gram-positive bacteria) TaxID=2657482 RepID=UPI003CF53CD3